MESPISDYLAELLERCGQDTAGAVADYIPALAEADPDRLGVCIATVDGQVYAAGDVDHAFTIQSISKPFAYALALDDLGIEAVLERVDVEPSGDAFNEISLERATGRPRNPMINAGALAIHGLIAGEAQADRDRRILELLSAVAGRELRVDVAVHSGELATAWRNRALGYLLRNTGILQEDPDRVVAGYVRQCAVEVTARDLALMAATLANQGRQVINGRQVITPASVRQVLSVMLTCGMYDSAGDWISSVGIPAKSGVSGGIIGVLPGQVGIAVFSPRLDEHGNSAAGVRVFEKLSADMGMHIMDARAENPVVIRDVEVLDHPDGQTTLWALQGDLRFNGAETALRRLVEDPPQTSRVVLDLHRVGIVDDVARRMMLEGLRRLQVHDRHTVLLIDPARTLGDGNPETDRGRHLEVGDGVLVRRGDSLEDLSQPQT